MYFFCVDSTGISPSAWHIQCVCVCCVLCLDVLIRLFPPGSIPFGAVEAADSSSQWLRRGWGPGAGSAGRSESDGGERHHGGVLSQVRYVYPAGPEVEPAAFTSQASFSETSTINTFHFFLCYYSYGLFN